MLITLGYLLLLAINVAFAVHHGGRMAYLLRTCQRVPVYTPALFVLGVTASIAVLSILLDNLGGGW